MRRFAFVVVGHVDHGKSTLIGRLLADTGSLQDGRLEKVQRICEEQRKPFEYAFLLDALEAEQLQGVTIDVTEVRFSWNGREYVIVDAPGHKEFMKNMITGAASAQAALLVVDAREGVQEQSRRHAYLLSFLGVRYVAVVVSKMDLVGYAQSAFDGIRSEYGRFLEGLSVRVGDFVPISAKAGDNVATRSSRMGWYAGPTVVELLESVRIDEQEESPALRLPVQDVYKFDDRRIIAGRVESGRLTVGDEIQAWPSGQRARVRSVETWPPTATGPQTVEAGETTGITLDYQLFVQRGDVVANPADPPRMSSFLVANVFWIGRSPLTQGRRYKLKMTTLERDVEVFSLARVMSPASMEVQADGTAIGQNEAGEVILSSSRPFIFDPASHIPGTGRFVLVDGYEVVGGGIVQEADEIYRRSYPHGLPKSAGISPVSGAITPADRAEVYGHRSHVVWLTGLPGAGKSTVACFLERALFHRQVKVFVIDGENLRFGLSADLGFTDTDRSEQARRAAEVARLFQLAGLVVIVALVSPFRVDREYARSLVGDEDFTLVYLHAPPSVLRDRDPHGLYSRAHRDGDPARPDLGVCYEPPESPSIALDTSGVSVERAGELILERVLRRIG